MYVCVLESAKKKKTYKRRMKGRAKAKEFESSQRQRERKTTLLWLDVRLTFDPLRYEYDKRRKMQISLQLVAAAVAAAKGGPERSKSKQLASGTQRQQTIQFRRYCCSRSIWFFLLSCVRLRDFISLSNLQSRIRSGEPAAG